MGVAGIPRERGSCRWSAPRTRVGGAVATALPAELGLLEGCWPRNQSEAVPPGMVSKAGVHSQCDAVRPCLGGCVCALAPGVEYTPICAPSASLHQSLSPVDTLLAECSGRAPKRPGPAIRAPPPRLSRPECPLYLLATRAGPEPRARPNSSMAPPRCRLTPPGRRAPRARRRRRRER